MTGSSAVLWLLIAAPFVGSFLGMLVYRLPAGKPVVFARSSCPYCDHRLGVRDLIPFVSWLATRGRCRSCDAALGVLYPVMELGALAVAAWAALVLPAGLVWAGCLLGWTLLVLAAVDIRHLLLPDVLTLPLIAAGLAVAWLVDPGRAIHHLIGAAIGFAGFVIVAAAYRLARGREGLGGGDAKLAAAAGAWVSWEGLAAVVFVAAVIGLASIIAARLAGRPVAPDTRVPFGACLAVGTWLVWLYGPLVLA